MKKYWYTLLFREFEVNMWLPREEWPRYIADQLSLQMDNATYHELRGIRDKQRDDHNYGSTYRICWPDVGVYLDGLTHMQKNWLIQYARAYTYEPEHEDEAQEAKRHLVAEGVYPCYDPNGFYTYIYG